MSDILLNSIQTPDGTILTSTHRHSFQVHVDKNGETYFVDGGTDYIRTSINDEPATDLSLTTSSPFEKIRVALKRTTADGKQIPLCEMTNEHLINCIKYNSERWGDGPIDKFTWQYIRELNYRYEHNLYKL